MILKRTLNF